MTNHYESFLNLSKLIYDQEISRLRQTSQNKVSYSISPASINAFYVPTENTISKIYSNFLQEFRAPRADFYISENLMVLYNEALLKQTKTLNTRSTRMFYILLNWMEN